MSHLPTAARDNDRRDIETMQAVPQGSGTCRIYEH